MKNLIKMICILVATSFSSQLFAQSSMVGFRAGVAVSTLNENPLKGNALGLDKTYLPAMDFVVFGKFGISQLFSVQPEVQFIQKGVKYINKDVNPEMKLNERVNYLEVPVLARFDFGLGNMVGSEPGGASFNAYIGPSLGYAMSGVVKGENAQMHSEAQTFSGDFEEDITWDDEFGIDETKDNRFDVSGVVGLGLDIDLGPIMVVFDGRFIMDFTDRVSYENEPSPSPDKYFNRTIAVTAGIAVPLGL